MYRKGLCSGTTDKRLKNKRENAQAERIWQTPDLSRQGLESREVGNVGCARDKWAGRLQQSRFGVQGWCIQILSQRPSIWLSALSYEAWRTHVLIETRTIPSAGKACL